MKRLFDALVSASAVILLLPLYVALSVLILIFDGPPIFFRQRRLGLHEKPFHVLKFRTMVKDAPKLGPGITSGRDPRITRLGAFLRRYKLDELPQFWNVLKGDMSIVGPRPEVPEMLQFYTPEERAIFNVRPGITDPASLAFADEAEMLARQDDPQKYYREVHMHKKLAISIVYIKNANPLSDIGIVLQTMVRIVTAKKSGGS